MNSWSRRHYCCGDILRYIRVYSSIYYLYLILFHLPRGRSEVGAGVEGGYWQSLWNIKVGRHMYRISIYISGSSPTLTVQYILYIRIALSALSAWTFLSNTLRIRANILPSRLRSMKKYMLSSLFEKLRGARDKTLVCKNRNRNVIAKHSLEQISRKQ